MPGPVLPALAQPKGMSEYQNIGASTQVFQQAACVSVTNQTLSGHPTIDSYQTVVDDVVLLTGQTISSQNGLYHIPYSGAWQRATGFSTGTIIRGMIVAIMEGTTYNGAIWVLRSPTASTVVDTSPQLWAEVSGSGGGGGGITEIVAGAGVNVSTVGSVATVGLTPLPYAPSNVTVTPGNNSAVVDWVTPAAVQPTPVAFTAYIIYIYVAGVLETSIGGISPTVNTYTIASGSGLVNGTTYTVTVGTTDTSTFGYGPQSIPSAAFTPSGGTETVPGAPTNVVATAGNTTAGLTWTAAPNGGSALTGQTVTPQIGGVNQTPISIASGLTAYTVTGLINGTTYTFIISATNAIGTGANSVPSNAVEPTAGGGPVPMVSAYADYVIYTDSSSGVAGEFNFAGMSSMTGAAFLAANTEWELTNDEEYELPTSASLMSIVNGTGLVMQTTQTEVAGIDTNPNTVSGGGFGCKAPYYREFEYTPAYYDGESVNHPSIWTLTTETGDDAVICGEIDGAEGGYGQNAGSLHTGNESQYSTYGPTNLPTSGTHKYGLYVTSTSVTWYCNDGTGGAVVNHGTYDFPTNVGTPPSDTVWYPLLDNAPGNPPANYGESSPTVTGANGEIIVGYDYWFVAP